MRAWCRGWISGLNPGAQARQDWSSRGPPRGSQHQPVLVHGGWDSGGRIDAAGPAVGAAIDEILSSFDLEHDFLGFGVTHVVPKTIGRVGS